MRAAGMLHHGAQGLVLWLAGAGLIRALSPEGMTQSLLLALLAVVLLVHISQPRRARLDALKPLSPRESKSRPATEGWGEGAPAFQPSEKRPHPPVGHLLPGGEGSKIRSGHEYRSTLRSTAPKDIEALTERIDDLLPQTQCGQCGFGGCRPYAQSLARGESDINRCPPGGVAGIEKLSALLHRPSVPLDPACGIEKPRVLAFIVEADCIGCTKCIQACPVDAIVGAPKLMHDVIVDRCTGCELCVPACPVDCIELRPA